MCGRYVSSRSDAELIAEFGIGDGAVSGESLRPSFNVAPTQSVRAVLERPPIDDEDSDPERQLWTVRWGLVPFWAQDISIGSKMINARMETILEKRTFKTAALRRRCLLPADGYYEWEKREGSKTKVPWYLTSEDGGGLAFAGLYERWADPDKAKDDPTRWLWTVTVITHQAEDALGHIHERTPLIVPKNYYSDWLDSTRTELDDVRDMMDSLPTPRLSPHVVSTAVNKVGNNGPELIQAVPDPQ